MLARLHDHLGRLLAPILPHTAEELWDLVPAGTEKPSSVHLAEWPVPDPAWDDPARDLTWSSLLSVRDEILRELEKLRAAKVIGSAQEAIVMLGTEDAELLSLLQENRTLLTTLAIVSEVQIAGELPADAARGVDLPALRVVAGKSPHAKCERCWNLRPTVGADAMHPTLCDRCVRVVSEINAVG